MPLVVPLAWTMMSLPGVPRGPPADPPLGAARRRLRADGVGRLPRPADGRRRALALGRPDAVAARRRRHPADQLRRLVRRRHAADAGAHRRHSPAPPPASASTRPSRQRCSPGPGSATSSATSSGSAPTRSPWSAASPSACWSCPTCGRSGSPAHEGSRRRRCDAVGTALAVAGTAHAAWNLRRLRVPPPDPPPVAERVAVLLPVRDEAHRVAPCVRSVLAQRGVRDLAVLVLDDGSQDGTAEVVRRAAAGDDRLRLLAGAELPAGWWGKPWACQQLADAAHAAPTCSSSSTPTWCWSRTPSRRRSPCCGGPRSTSSRPTHARWRSRRPSGWSSRCCSGPG